MVRRYSIDKRRAELRRKHDASEGIKPVTYETRAVLAGAYVGRLAGRTLLTHSVAIDHSSGRPEEVQVLCMRVRLDSLADRGAMDPYTAPSCKSCKRRLNRLLGIRS